MRFWVGNATGFRGGHLVAALQAQGTGAWAHWARRWQRIPASARSTGALTGRGGDILAFAS